MNIIRFPLSLILVLTLFLTGCGASTVITALELVTAASEAAIGALEASGQISPATAMLIDGYLAGVSTATQFASVELASNDAPAVKAAKIAAEFAKVAAPNLPAGTDQAIVLAIQAVANAVANFLSQIQPTPPPKLPKLTAEDGLRLQQIRVRAEIVHAKVSRRR